MAHALPRLTTDRLILRELQFGDLDDIVRIAGNYDVSKWLVPVAHPYSLEDATAFFQDAVQGKLGLNWAIQYTDRFVGVIGIDPGLGYWSCPSVWGKGLMSEAVLAVVDAFFQLSDEGEIRSSYFEGNIGSARVLEKAGFVSTGPGSQFSRARNEAVPSTAMVLTRERWMSPKRSISVLP